MRLGIDIGGTLAKVVVVADADCISDTIRRFPCALLTQDKFSDSEIAIQPVDLCLEEVETVDMSFAMFSFTSRNIEPLIDFLRFLFHASNAVPAFINVTGGGALKFQKELRNAFPNTQFYKVEEMDAIAVGFSFLVRRANSAFLFDSQSQERIPVPLEEVSAPFPLLLVNIGSGVSMIHITGPGDFKRVQGSPIGGGTVVGLGKALFQAKSFEEIMELSMVGDSSKVDLSVGELLGAPPNDEFWNMNTLAASLAKLNTLSVGSISRSDLAQSIVRMVSYNIGYIAYLVSCLHKVNRIYFSGKYVNKHIPTMEAIAYAVKFYENWKPPPCAFESNAPQHGSSLNVGYSGRKCEVRFLHQEGYVGAIGALLGPSK
jgi:type II pantothenate kinase